jgi:hypothetical protein
VALFALVHPLSEIAFGHDCDNPKAFSLLRSLQYSAWDKLNYSVMPLKNRSSGSMTNPLVAALEQAFQDVRDRDVPLGERLCYVADQVRSLSTVFAEAVDTFVDRLESAGAGNYAPQIGEPISAT